MATFMTNLWEGVFTPGPTPTLLIATNATFAALQALLLALLLATYSIHFAVLSFLCGGLWWSVNWFAHELKAAQAKELEAEKLRKKRRDGERGAAGGVGADPVEADDEGEETEVEAEGMKGLRTSVESLDEGGPGRTIPRAAPGNTGARAGDEQAVRGVLTTEDLLRAVNASRKSTQAEPDKTAASTGLQPPSGLAAPRQRNASADLSSASEVSTDSEWEKISNRGG